MFFPTQCINMQMQQGLQALSQHLAHFTTKVPPALAHKTAGTAVQHKAQVIVLATLAYTQNTHTYTHNSRRSHAACICTAASYKAMMSLQTL
jgi:hypothetical protein